MNVIELAERRGELLRQAAALATKVRHLSRKRERLDAAFLLERLDAPNAELRKLQHIVLLEDRRLHDLSYDELCQDLEDAEDELAKIKAELDYITGLLSAHKALLRRED